MTYGDYEPGSWGIGGLPEVWASRTDGNIETAMHHRGDFPRHWGKPAGDKFSDERRSWIAARIAADRRRRGGNARVALMRVLELS